eukprot:jgi/Undpi1/12888/HiC_scaffold_7.g02554.m1
MGDPSQQESIWFWKESCVKVANNSDYKVSYWVEQECKMKTRAIQETVLTTMEAKLNGKASTDGAEGMLLGAVRTGAVSVSARAAKRAKTETTVTTEQTEMESYFLMKDHRMGPRRATPSTSVNFPENCKQLRVYAFFQAKDGTWKSYKDKVYSIGRRKRQFTLTALNANIKPYL